LSIEFNNGFSVFTGETGAGKSILIGAIGLILGERASAESIRSGSTESEITGIFELDNASQPLKKQLEEADITLEDNTLIIRRIISKTGRNRIQINQVPVPLSTLRAIGDHLVDFHGQHEHQSLLKQETACVLINNLPEINPVWKKYQSSYTGYIAERCNLENFDKKAAAIAEKRDMIEFQYNELTDMELQLDEERNLEDEFKLISSITERLECVSSIHSIIEDNGDTISLERQISAIRKNLSTLQKFDSSVAPWLSDIENSITFFSELNTFCTSYLNDTQKGANPVRLEQINSRIAKIQRLKKKYRCSFNGLIDKQANLKKQLDSIENMEADRSVLEKKLVQVQKQCQECAEKLSYIRKKTSVQFDKAITKQMEKLGFPGGKWKTTFIPEQGLTPNGLEHMVFEVRTNIGEPFLPLIKTASGGEISRLMPAIQTILASQHNIPILIFDEIDAGIGGLLAKEVADSLYKLKESHQVLCISHLHQIASIADHHYHVYKTSDEDRTITRVSILDEKDKIEEISRMLGSDSTISKKHAKELLSKK
jgi:DNA repair protein RecN (Recombination protein N)